MEDEPRSVRIGTYRVLMTCFTCLVLAALAMIAFPSPHSTAEQREAAIAMDDSLPDATPVRRERQAVPHITTSRNTPSNEQRTDATSAGNEGRQERAFGDKMRVLVESVQQSREALDRLDTRQDSVPYSRAALEAIVPTLLEVSRQHPELMEEVLSKAFESERRSSPRRPVANETAAISTLRNLASAQSQLQASGALDQDEDGQGEYGFFGELSGARTLRGSERTLNPPVLSAAFRQVEQGAVKRSGYAFRIYLPDAQGNGIFEAGENETAWSVTGSAAAALGETTWCAYAWPLTREAGTRVFFVNQQGDILACSNTVANGGQGYYGDAAPNPLAAFRVEGFVGLISGNVAVNTQGWDGEQWVVVN
ncbi:MAG: hypothetical protein H6833_08790 [Planctomycetes bacterium]|nr:hypothetical protein [Planctomycetota bacterium]